MDQMERIGDDIFKVLDAVISIPVLVFNAEKIVYMNDACRKMFDYNEIGMNTVFMEKIPDSKVFLDIWNDFQAANSNINKEIFFYNNNHEKIVIEYNGKAVEYKDGKFILVQLNDITEKKKIEGNLLHLSKVRALMLEISQSVVKLEDINEIYDLILSNALKCIDNSDLGSIFILEDEIFKVVAYKGFSPVIEDFVLSKSECILYTMTEGKMDQIKYAADLSVFNHFTKVETESKESKTIQATITTPIIIKGELFGMINIDSFTKNIFSEEDLRTMQFIKNSVEIAIANHLLYEKTRYLAKYDSLTNLYNRAYFRESFNKIKLQYLENGKFFQVVLFDLNNLKKINDIIGHHAGDIAIKATADALKRTLHNKDLLSRIGGDEFCGVYLDITKEKLREILESCLDQLERTEYCVDGKKITVSYSYGIAEFSADGTEYEDLTKAADERMYYYKKTYKDCRK